jgi:hypothetical protein
VSVENAGISSLAGSKNGSGKVVASSSGTPEKNAVSATTKNEPKNGSGKAVANGSGNEQTKIVSWRTEINRRRTKKGSYHYHWIYRLTLANGKRMSRYGGKIDTLPMPSRWSQYKRNSKKLAKRKAKK